MGGANGEVRAVRLQCLLMLFGLLLFGAGSQSAAESSASHSLRGGGEKEPSPHSSSCHCSTELQSARSSICECDLVDIHLAQEMLRLGLHRCTVSGACEACPSSVLSVGYCARTAWRQRVVCAICQPGNPEKIEICSAPESGPNRPLWIASSISVASDTAAGSGKNKAKTKGGSKGKEKGKTKGKDKDRSKGEQFFYRSCDSPSESDTGYSAPARGGPLSQRSAPAEDGSSSFWWVGAKTPVVNSTASAHNSQQASDESMELFCFAIANIVVLIISLASLRRQQRSAMQKTMKGFSEQVGHAAGEQQVKNVCSSKSRAASTSSGMSLEGAQQQLEAAGKLAVAAAVSALGSMPENAGKDN